MGRGSLRDAASSRARTASVKRSPPASRSARLGARHRTGLPGAGRQAVERHHARLLERLRRREDRRGLGESHSRRSRLQGPRDARAALHDGLHRRTTARCPRAQPDGRVDILGADLRVTARSLRTLLFRRRAPRRRPRPLARSHRRSPERRQRSRARSGVFRPGRAERDDRQAHDVRSAVRPQHLALALVSGAVRRRGPDVVVSVFGMQTHVTSKDKTLYPVEAGLRRQAVRRRRQAQIRRRGDLQHALVVRGLGARRLGLARRGLHGQLVLADFPAAPVPVRGGTRTTRWPCSTRTSSTTTGRPCAAAFPLSTT